MQDSAEGQSETVTVTVASVSDISLKSALLASESRNSDSADSNQAGSGQSFISWAMH